MTHAQRLALVTADVRDSMGDDQAPSLHDQLEASLFEAMAKRLRAQDERIKALEQMEVKHRAVINRILTRFVVERRPIPGEAL